MFRFLIICCHSCFAETTRSEQPPCCDGHYFCLTKCTDLPTLKDLGGKLTPFKNSLFVLIQREGRASDWKKNKSPLPQYCGSKSGIFNLRNTFCGSK